MHWKKLGLVFNVDKLSEWQVNSALTPTPFLVSEKRIRVYCGFRDINGVSRIGYIDVSAENPTEVIAVSDEPVLDIGDPGCFDDNGVILGDVVRVGDEIRMYYVGFQIAQKVKFLAFSGLAISRDGGQVFEKISNAPILDRSNYGRFIMAIHSVIKEGDKYRVWFAAGDGWAEINGCNFPRYSIYYIESPDGVFFDPRKAVKCIDNNQRLGEYRIGRPSVFKNNGKYLMYFTKGTLSGQDYTPGFATSADGYSWVRNDSDLGISLSESGWDSKHLCYPRFISTKFGNYLFYNGNDMGKQGFGVAVLDET